MNNIFDKFSIRNKSTIYYKEIFYDIQPYLIQGKLLVWPRFELKCVSNCLDVDYYNQIKLGLR